MFTQWWTYNRVKIVKRYIQQFIGGNINQLYIVPPFNLHML